MILKSLKMTMATLSMVLFAQSASAYFCTGTVTELSLDPSGQVYLSTSFGLSFTRLCNVANAPCRASYATLLLAKTSGKQVSFAFGDGSRTCATQPAWADPVGLYYGPQLH